MRAGSKELEAEVLALYEFIIIQWYQQGGKRS